MLSVLGLIPMPPGRIASGEALYKGEDLAEDAEEGAARAPRRRDGDDLPGPDDVAEPGVHDRRPDLRGDAHAQPGHEGRRGSGADDRAPRARRRALRRAARRPVSARVLGRHAPARDDRDGDGEQPERPHRRRADDRARRDDPGADRRGHQGRAGANARGDHPHHARPRAHRRARRPRRRHVRGPGRRARRRVHDLRRRRGIRTRSGS